MNACKRWVLRRAGSAQCSPALVVAGMVLVAAVVAYVYRQEILNTLMIMACATAGLAVTAIVVVFTLRVLRSEFATKRPEPAPAQDTEPEPEEAVTGPIPVTQKSWPDPDPNAKSIEADAEMLSDDALELVWNPDGSLTGRRS
jgi:hypothetical protein